LERRQLLLPQTFLLASLRVHCQLNWHLFRDVSRLAGRDKGQQHLTVMKAHFSSEQHHPRRRQTVEGQLSPGLSAAKSAFAMTRAAIRI
jgi:hypothetical protein